MNATDKDYIDARLEATVARFAGELNAHELTLNGRLDALAQTMTAGFKSLHEEIETRALRNEAYIAQVEANVHKAIANLIKWVVATVLGSMVGTISIMSFLVTNAAPKTPNVPIIVYAQPAPAPQQAPKP